MNGLREGLTWKRRRTNMNELTDTNEPKIPISRESRDIRIPRFTGRLADYIVEKILGCDRFETGTRGKRLTRYLNADDSAVYVKGRTIDKLWAGFYEVRDLNGIGRFPEVQDLVLLSHGSPKYAKPEEKVSLDELKENPIGCLEKYKPQHYLTKRYFNNVRVSKLEEGLYRVELVGIKYLKGKQISKPSTWKHTIFDENGDFVRNWVEQLPPPYCQGDIGIDALVKLLFSPQLALL